MIRYLFLGLILIGCTHSGTTSDDAAQSLDAKVIATDIASASAPATTPVTGVPAAGPVQPALPVAPGPRNRQTAS